MTLNEYQTRAEAARVRAETQAWVKDVSGQYGELRRQMDGVFELARHLTGLEEHVRRMDGMAAGLQEKVDG